MTPETGKDTPPDGRQPAGTEAVGSEGPDLDSLLREYEEGNKASQTPKEKRSLNDLAPVIQFAKDELANKARERQEKGITEAISAAKDAEGLKNLPDKLVLGLANAYAMEDPSFDQAFRERTDKPQAWKTAISAFQDWAKDQMKDFTSARSDVEAAKAAVAGKDNKDAGKEGYDPAELIAMSDVDFERTWQKELVKSAR